MNRVIALVVGLALCSIPVLAGEYLMNEDVAHGLRVTFSAPVTLTYFGDVLMTVSPEGESTEFVFSGAELPPWLGHGLAWTPASAMILSYEWLSQRQVAAVGVVRVPLTTIETFPVILTATSGETLDATITRTMSQEQIPFVVEYAIDIADETLALTWTRLTPWLQIEGTEARSVQLSNAEPIDFLLEAKTPSGLTYQWEEELDFLLHSLTEITLDATQFVPEAEIESVTWTAENGDPDDAKTFPIGDPNAPVTPLVSQWPNVLTVSCEVRKQDRAILRETVEALIYFRDGTPFETRSTEVSLFDVFTPPQLNDILDVMFPLLRGLGVNALYSQIRWWFGQPDATGNWDVIPLVAANESELDPRGTTPSLENLELLVSRAREFGMVIQFQLRQYPNKNDPQLREDYWSKYYPLRTTDKFLYGDGSGWHNQLLYYLPFFAANDDVVTTVLLNTETGGILQQGGEKTREFILDAQEEFRAGGYSGNIAYGMGYSSDSPPQHPENYLPEVCGIPWASLDRMGITFYPRLASTTNSTTESMLEEFRTQFSHYLMPLFELYSTPLLITECYCNGYDCCATSPLRTSGEPNIEQTRRYFSAILRGFSSFNSPSEGLVTTGIAMSTYTLRPSSWKPAPDDFAFPMLNDVVGHLEIQLLIKVFYSDRPLAH